MPRSASLSSHAVEWRNRRPRIALLCQRGGTSEPGPNVGLILRAFYQALANARVVTLLAGRVIGSIIISMCGVDRYGHIPVLWPGWTPVNPRLSEVECVSHLSCAAVDIYDKKYGEQYSTHASSLVGPKSSRLVSVRLVGIIPEAHGQIKTAPGRGNWFGSEAINLYHLCTRTTTNLSSRRRAFYTQDSTSTTQPASSWPAPCGAETAPQTPSRSWPRRQRSWS